MTLKEFLETLAPYYKYTEGDIENHRLVFEYEYYPEFVYPIQEIIVDSPNNKITLKCKTKNRKEEK